MFNPWNYRRGERLVAALVILSGTAFGLAVASLAVKTWGVP